MATDEGVTIGLIVEGHGEEKATPTLIRKIAHEFNYFASLKFEVRRLSKSQLVRPKELERSVEALSRQIGRGQPILVLLDADDDCPMILANALKERCLAAHADVTISIVIAKKEYEAWFLAAAKSLAGKIGSAAQLDPPLEPESVQGAKEWLSKQMITGQSYSPTRHQSDYSAIMDLSEARTARSFLKFEKEVCRLLGCPQS